MVTNSMEDQVYLCGTRTVRFLSSENGRLRPPENIHDYKCFKTPSFPSALALMDPGLSLVFPRMW